MTKLKLAIIWLFKDGLELLTSIYYAERF